MMLVILWRLLRKCPPPPPKKKKRRSPFDSASKRRAQAGHCLAPTITLNHFLGPDSRKPPLSGLHQAVHMLLDGLQLVAVLPDGALQCREGILAMGQSRICLALFGRRYRFGEWFTWETKRKPSILWVPPYFATYPNAVDQWT